MALERRARESRSELRLTYINRRVVCHVIGPDAFAVLPSISSLHSAAATPASVANVEFFSPKSRTARVNGRLRRHPVGSRPDRSARGRPHAMRHSCVEGSPEPEVFDSASSDWHAAPRLVPQRVQHGRFVKYSAPTMGGTAAASFSGSSSGGGPPSDYEIDEALGLPPG
jgi:hypothetical protein